MDIANIHITPYPYRANMDIGPMEPILLVPWGCSTNNIGEIYSIGSSLGLVDRVAY